ncbi:hypothetical protein QTP70_001710 [Hemibagrus guttatus]|uniref:ribonuclease H n=1 Tax=Hemibagrus guttatus TaxID=175788 RepID=A0AAE0R5V6_9TELE|nr:hypothetical protein QTP70_001710 [Hemibagrus guttatus]
MCRGERGEPALHTQYSNPQPLWITGESSPVSLIINPSRTQHFTNDSLSLSCEDQSNSTGWTVRRYTHSERVLDCSHWGSVTGSTCNISFLSTSYTGVYWCESESGENSNPVNITVHDGDVILESPVHPVTEGHPLTLRCLYHNPNPSNLRADFYKDGSVLQNQTTGEMIIQTVSKSDEGFYHCKHPERGESPKSWLSVRPLSSQDNGGSNGGTVGLVVGLGFLLMAFLILMILLWSCKRKKGSANIYATVDEADLEKAYDRVPREELWCCMRKSGVAEKYVRVVQDMYERSRTVVRCAVGQTEEFNVEVGLHQGSALSPFLFAIVMDQLSEEVRQESPWTMMFSDDIVICSESREQVEENLERWRFALERRGMKVSRSKTEYMCVNEREGSGTVRLQGEEVKKVQEFKYLGSTVQSNGECGKEVKKRVQAGWNGWRKVSGVLCDQKISARIKGKVYRTVVRPAMLYALETVSLRKRQESELEVAELKMLRDNVGEARLRWFGHVQRREIRRMDPNTSASGGAPLQNTSPIMDPAELRDIIVRQGASIRSYQEQMESLQDQLRSASLAAPRDPPAARGESPCLALPDKFEGSADRCRGFLRQCEVFFSHQPEMYSKGETQCALVMSLLTDRALEWASAVWDADPQIRSSFVYFSGMIREVFEYPAGGQDISIQLMELRQGSDAAADYAIRFRTLAAQSGWNDAALWAVFRAGLKPELQAELACRTEDTTLSQFVAMAIRLDNLLRQHQAGPSRFSSSFREEVPEPMQMGKSGLAEPAQQQWSRMRLCYNCGASGHLSPRCPERPSSAQVGGGSRFFSLLVPVSLCVSNRGVSVSALIDSGAAVNLIDGALVERLGIPTFPCLPPLRITAIDSRPIGEGYLKRQTELLKFRVGLFHHERLAFYVTSSPANPVILGFPWLRRHDPKFPGARGSWYAGHPPARRSACRTRYLGPVGPLA